MPVYSVASIFMVIRFAPCTMPFMRRLNKAGGLKRQLTPKMATLHIPSPSPVKAVLNAQGYNVVAAVCNSITQ